MQPQDAVVVDFVGRLLVTTTDDTTTNTEGNKTETNEKSRENDVCASEGPVFHEAVGWLLVIGEKDVVPALEMGIRFMRQGETALVESHSKYAYGSASREWNTNVDVSSSNSSVPSSSNSKTNHKFLLPPHSRVQYTVTVQRIVPVSELSNPPFQLMLCQSKKQIANDIYNHDCVSETNLYAKNRAIHIYHRAAEMLRHMLREPQQHNDDDDNLSASFDRDRDAARICFLDCLNNIAAVQLRCQSFHAAKEACVAVLEQDPTNTKALLRAAQASMRDPASTYEEVEAAIQAAEASSSSERMNGDIAKLRNELQKRQSEYTKKERSMWFAKMTKPATSQETAAARRKRPASENTETAIAGSTESANDHAKDQVPLLDPRSDDDNKSTLDTNDKASMLLSTRLYRFCQALPWRRTILPYGFQFVLPWILYVCFRFMRHNNINSDETTDEEL